MTPFFPLGFGRVNDRQLAYGVRDGEKAYLSVFTVHGDTAEIPLKGLKRKIGAVKVIYPASADCAFEVREDDTLCVKMPADVCARLFEISFAE